LGVVEYHLYLLYYASKSHNTSSTSRQITDNLRQRTRQLASQGCHLIFSKKNVKVIAQMSRDARDVNLAMMDAYLDDGVDFFLLVFPRVRTASDDDLQRLPSRSLVCL